MVFFFFKQKTAYEMRISDWSSDVCSSDLQTLASDVIGLRAAEHRDQRTKILCIAEPAGGDGRFLDHSRNLDVIAGAARLRLRLVDCPDARRVVHDRQHGVYGRSEEHTSELQSLMRITYAVFCLKKKKI